MQVRCLLLALVGACGAPADDDLRSVTAKVDDARGGYALDVQVNGFTSTGIATSVWINVEAGQERYITHRRCPTWLDQTVTLNGVPLMQLLNGGPLFGLGNAPNGACQQAVWELIVDDLATWRDAEQLTLQISDASGLSEFRFENFIRTPVVTVADPADGHVRQGGSFTLAFNPSVDVLTGFTLQAAPHGTMLQTAWGNYAMSSVAIDHYTAKLPVPANAQVGLLTLNFDTGNHPDGFGFRGGVLQCDDAIYCAVRRVSGGGLALPEYSLDDTAVTFELTVDP